MRVPSVSVAVIGAVRGRAPRSRCAGGGRRAAMRGASQGSSCSRPTCQKRWAIAARSASGSPRNQPRVRRVSAEQLVDEGPVGLGERRRVVAVDDVDPLRPRLGQQRGPLERALAPAEDQHAPAARGPRSRPCATVWDHCSGARRSTHEREARRRSEAMPGAATTRSAWMRRSRRRGEPRTTAVSSMRVFDAPRQRLDPLLRREPVRVRDERLDRDRLVIRTRPMNASNVCTPAASRCHSRPDRSSIPSGMLRRQNRIGSPTTVTDSPCRRASAATARPYGPGADDQQLHEAAYPGRR